MIEEYRIIGIDPGTNLLGFGVINICGSTISLVDMGVVDMRKEKDGYSKLNKIFIEISNICKKYQPKYMALESPFLDKNAQVIMKLGRAQGSAILAGTTNNIEICEYAPRKVKSAITGNGAASKEQVCNILSKTLNIKLEPKFMDATDAVAIALCHYYSLNGLSITKKSSASAWEDFIKNNPSRVK